MDDVDPSQLPDGWSIDSDGYFYTWSTTPATTGKFVLDVFYDTMWFLEGICFGSMMPVMHRSPVDGLDLVRSTLVHHVNGGQTGF